MTRLLAAFLTLTTFSTCSPTEAHAATNYLIVARRTGAVEFIDPATLHTLRTIQIETGSEVGLNGIFADPAGRSLYLEGPIPANALGSGDCCWLYSIDLPTLEIKVAAGMWGTSSRRAFVSAGPGLLKPAPPAPDNATPKLPVSESQLADGFPVPGCQAPALTKLISAGDRLIFYEVFGGKLDRREGCDDVPWRSLNPGFGNRPYAPQTSHAAPFLDPHPQPSRF